MFFYISIKLNVEIINEGNKQIMFLICLLAISKFTTINHICYTIYRKPKLELNLYLSPTLVPLRVYAEE